MDGDGGGVVVDAIGFDCNGRVVSGVALDEVGEREVLADLRRVVGSFRSTEAKHEVHGYLTPF